MTIHRATAKLHAVKLWIPDEDRQIPMWLLESLSKSPGPGATGTSLTDFLENELLDHVLSAATYTPPANTTFALYTAAPSDTGGGTEVTGGSYARISKTNNATTWPAASGGAKSNGVAVDFATATADWGTVTHAGIFDGSTNLLFWGALDSSRLVKSGDTFSFPIGNLDVLLD